MNFASTFAGLHITRLSMAMPPVSWSAVTITSVFTVFSAKSNYSANGFIKIDHFTGYVFCVIGATTPVNLWTFYHQGKTFSVLLAGCSVLLLRLIVITGRSQYFWRFHVCNKASQLNPTWSWRYQLRVFCPPGNSFSGDCLQGTCVFSMYKMISAATNKYIDMVFRKSAVSSTIALEGWWAINQAGSSMGNGSNTTNPVASWFLCYFQLW